MTASPTSRGAEAGEWVLVPREPTPEMIDAGWIDKEDVDPDDIYRAMIAASPPAPVTGTEDIFGNFNEADYKPDLASAIAAEIMGLGWALPEYSGDEEEEADEQHRRYGMVQDAVCAVLTKAQTHTMLIPAPSSQPSGGCGDVELERPCVPDCSAADHLDYLEQVIQSCVKIPGVKADALGAIRAISASLAPDLGGGEKQGASASQEQDNGVRS